MGFALERRNEAGLISNDPKKNASHTNESDLSGGDCDALT